MSSNTSALPSPVLTSPTFEVELDSPGNDANAAGAHHIRFNVGIKLAGLKSKAAEFLPATVHHGGAQDAPVGAAVLSEYDREEAFESSNFVFAAMEHHAREHSMAVRHPKLQAFLGFAISPKNPWRLRWDLMMLVVVVYNSVIVPYDAAFRPNKPPGWLSYTMDVLFYSDILLNFFTGYDRGYEVVMAKRKIISHYLRSWFFLDLLATVDWGVAVSSFRNDRTTPLWIKMLALLKIFRLLRAGRLIDKLTTSWSMQTGLVDAIKFFLYVSVVAHLLACFFFLCPVLFQWGDCDQDLEASDAVRECISGGDCGDGSPTDGIGWYFAGQCRQNGWRQMYNLEEICVPQLCSPHVPGGEFDLSYDLYQYADLGTRCNPDSEFATSRPMTTTEEMEFLLRCLDTAEQQLAPWDSRYQLCPLCMLPSRLWLDSLYWSLTTMTTIGYGDRGPETENELYYVMFAEIFGLAFFALLLTQIDRVNILLTKTKQDIRDSKDAVMQFAKSRDLPEELVTHLIRYMNFRASSMSGNAYSNKRTGFSALSENLQVRIKRACYLPTLKKIGFFGWDEKYDEEEDIVRKFFNDIDTDKGEKLEKDEVRTLFERLDLALTEKHFDACWEELDRKKNNHVSFDEFSWWWFLTKYGVPRISSGVKCPSEFLDKICECLVPRSFAKGERLVQLGNYGENFVIALAGQLLIKRPGTRWGSAGSHPDDEGRNNSRDTTINPEDREPIFGYCACLTKAQHDYVKYRTDFWTVEANEYADTLWVTRQHFYELFAEYWPTGRKDLVELCYYHYQIALICHGRTEMKMDPNGVVGLDAFAEGPSSRLVRSSSRVPHGFRQCFERDQKATGRAADETAKLLSLPSTAALADSAEEATGEEDLHEAVHDALREMETENHFASTTERVIDKIYVMEEEMVYLRDDLAGVVRNFELLVDHLKECGMKGTQDFEMAPPEDPSAWFDRRKKARLKKQAEERARRRRKDRLSAATRAMRQFASISQDL